MRLAEEQFRVLFETAPFARLVIDRTGTITIVNSQAERVFGYRREELIGRSVEELVPTAPSAPRPWYLPRLDRDRPVPDSSAELELRAVRKDGSEFPVEISLVALSTEHGPMTSAAVKDVTEQKRAAEALAHRASHDPLTGLPNRALFMDRLEHALRRARRSGRKLGVVFLDLDDFKLVNDTRGHEVGDRLLLALTPRLRSALRPGDTIARFGGDEFVVLCEDLSSEADAIRIATRITNSSRQPLTPDDSEYTATVSAGVVVVDDAAGTSASAVLRDADAAMYRAKAAGKGRVEVFDQGMRAHLIERLTTESALRHALQRHELRLFYQPIVSLQDNRIVGVEALLRWQHPDRGLLGPADFISVAESSGLIVEIGEWVISEACRQAAAWRRAAPDGDPVHVSVNLSPKQVMRADVAQAVEKILVTTELDPSLLEFEIMESTLLEDEAACTRSFRDLKAVGVRLVLDDFGTGYSSLSHLKDLTIDGLKIDRSFVSGLADGDQDAAIVAAVVSMASALDVEVTAEGVETPGQLAKLRQQGCELGQGYLFARPAPPEDLTELIGAGRSARIPV